jgi:hypothetical protein
LRSRRGAKTSWRTILWPSNWSRRCSALRMLIAWETTTWLVLLVCLFVCLFSLFG